MRRRRAFTLVELLVVVAVLVALAAIVLPVLAHTREVGRRANCLSNLRQLIAAHQMYVQDHDDTLPDWAYPRETGGSGFRREYVYWTEFLHPYYRDPRLLDQGFSTEQERRDGSWLADYVLCAWGSGGRGTVAAPYWRWPGGSATDLQGERPMALAEVQRTSETLQFADGLTTRFSSSVQGKHANQVMNGAFVDGHARRVSSAEWEQVDRDDRGYFYHIAAADR
jgi:prepilin-type N-terminal cleavage/methylation domain-containing protein/prepilin-type processing-associated H-X9-DG protein